MLVKVTSTGMSCSFLFQAGKILNPAVSVVPGDCGAGYTVSNISPCKYNGVSIVNPTAIPKSFMIMIKIFLYLRCYVFQTERWLYGCILFLNNLSIVTKLKIRTKSSDEKNIFFHLPACMVSSWLFQSVSCYPRAQDEFTFVFCYKTRHWRHIIIETLKQELSSLIMKR